VPPLSARVPLGRRHRAAARSVASQGRPALRFAYAIPSRSLPLVEIAPGPLRAGRRERRVQNREEVRRAERAASGGPAPPNPPARAALDLAHRARSFTRTDRREVTDELAALCMQHRVGAAAIVRPAEDQAVKRASRASPLRSDLSGDSLTAGKSCQRSIKRA
jgi:hypothetical protein